MNIQDLNNVQLLTSMVSASKPSITSHYYWMPEQTILLYTDEQGEITSKCYIDQVKFRPVDQEGNYND